MAEPKHKMGNSPTISYNTLIKKVSIIVLAGEPKRTSVYTYGPYLRPNVLITAAGKTAKIPASTR